MSGITLQPLSNELEQANRNLERGCDKFGVSAVMFRTAKFVFYIATLATTVFLIQTGVEPTLAMGFAVLLISGPEALETWLIHQGKLADPQGGTDGNS